MTSSLLRMTSPVGRIELSGDGEVVDRVVIESSGSLPRDAEPEAPDPVLRRAAEELAEYFLGGRESFTVPTARPGTAFQRAVWDGLLAIRSDGRITGYSAGEGLPTKEWLLGHEGIVLAGVA